MAVGIGKYWKKKNQLKNQKFLAWLKIYNYFKTLERENASLNFRLKKTDKTRNYYLEEIKHNELISKKHEKICKLWIMLNTYLF